MMIYFFTIRLNYTFIHLYILYNDTGTDVGFIVFTKTFLAVTGVEVFPAEVTVG